MFEVVMKVWVIQSVKENPVTQEVTRGERARAICRGRWLHVL